MFVLVSNQALYEFEANFVQAMSMDIEKFEDSWVWHNAGQVVQEYEVELGKATSGKTVATA